MWIDNNVFESFFDELGDERVSLSAAYILIAVGVFGGNTARLLQLACMNAQTHTRLNTDLSISLLFSSLSCMHPPKDA